MTGSAEHRPVLLEEAVAGLAIRPDGRYVDGTYGRGGHASRILEALGPDGRLLAIDRDPTAIAAARERWAGEPRFAIFRGNFSELRAAVAEAGWSGVDGLLLDLGVSSPQLDTAERGFSFQADGPLDMRMDTTRGETAAEWLAAVSGETLERVLRDYGEERYARRIVRAILAAREEEPITTTGRLATLVAAAVPTREVGKHPATRTFQAIRIAVNDELGAVESALAAALDVLRPGGRLSVISFHSLEDRIVKRFIRDQSSRPAGNRRLPVPVETAAPRLARIGKAIKPTREECEANPRARSAVLRLAERTDAA
ncbi:MAG: 16S rRNA (cytosine(1402)-N(4))-methyltransferase RsmH [Pseudomonadota bacterium]